MRPESAVQLSSCNSAGRSPFRVGTLALVTSSPRARGGVRRCRGDVSVRPFRTKRINGTGNRSHWAWFVRSWSKPPSATTTPTLQNSVSSRSSAASATRSATRCGACCSRRSAARRCGASASTAWFTSTRPSLGWSRTCTRSSPTSRRSRCRSPTISTKRFCASPSPRPARSPRPTFRTRVACSVIDQRHHLFTLQDDRDINVELYVNKGRGYVEADQHVIDRGLADRSRSHRLDLQSGSPRKLRRRRDARWSAHGLRSSDAHGRDERHHHAGRGRQLRGGARADALPVLRRLRLARVGAGWRWWRAVRAATRIDSRSCSARRSMISSCRFVP